jgi:hypothetical protein
MNIRKPSGLGSRADLARDPDGQAGELIKPLLSELLSKFSGVVWPVLAQAIGSSDKLRSWRMQSALGDPYFSATGRAHRS